MKGCDYDSSNNLFERVCCIAPDKRLYPHTVEPLTVTSDEQSPPVNGHFYSLWGVFLYILPLINGHLPPPVNGHNNLWFHGQNPSVKRSNWQRIRKTSDTEIESRKIKTHGNSILHQKKNLKNKRNTFLFIDKKYDNQLFWYVLFFFFFQKSMW